jgi:HTH-type transcriptional regulator/antitoxin HigA
MADKIHGYNPNLAIPPGETIRDYLESLGMTQVELAKRVNLTPKTVNEIIAGKAPITAQTAIALEYVFRTPARFWLELEKNYQETKARIEAREKIEEEKSIVAKIPYVSLSSLGFVPETKNVTQKVESLRSFFGVSSLNSIEMVNEAAFRKKKVEINTDMRYALAAWLRVGEIQAQEVKCNIFDEKKLKSLIPEIIKLSVEKPEVFLPKVQKLCADAGVVVTVVPHFPKTYVNGSARWLTPDKAIIQLSQRYKYLDIFWFTFLHEIGHILLHRKKDFFIDEDNADKDECEREADAFSAKRLIPPSKFKQLKRGTLTKENIIGFAESLQIHPGIVVGRLNHEGLLDYCRFNDLRERF